MDPHSLAPQYYLNHSLTRWSVEMLFPPLSPNIATL